MNNKVYRGFASDNNAGIHPQLLESIANANLGHTIAYGDDIYTKRAEESFKKHFGSKLEVFFVLTGTAANVLSLASANQSHHAVICADTAHINIDECGAPEKFTGSKLLTIATTNGKITPVEVTKYFHGIGFEHHVQPRVISISQPTEMGTVYKVDEIKALAKLAHDNNMVLHMDGARLANAAVTLDLPLRAFTVDAGVDVLSFGGTKNGMLFGESVVFFNSSLASDFRYRRKQSMQLASKMRFISAQFETYLETDVWRKNALHANAMARLLYDKVRLLPELKVTQPVEANAVFVIVPERIIIPLQERYFFYMWNEDTCEARWMTSFDTTAEDVDGFVALLRELLAG